MKRKKLAFRQLKTSPMSKVSRAVLEAAWTAKPEPVEVLITRKLCGLGGWKRGAFVEYFHLSESDDSQILEWEDSKSAFELEKTSPQGYEIWKKLWGTTARTFLSNCLLCGVPAAIQALYQSQIVPTNTRGLRPPKEDDMIKKNSQLRAVCGSCLDYDNPKQVIDIGFDTPACDVVSVTHRCPVCHKLSKSQYKKFSDGPIASENGYQLRN